MGHVLTHAIIADAVAATVVLAPSFSFIPKYVLIHRPVAGAMLMTVGNRPR